MTIVRSSRFILRVVFTGACTALMACGGPATSPPTTGYPAAAVNRPLGLADLTPSVIKPHFRHIVDVPRIRPNCCARQKILFVTDSYGESRYSGAVYAFDYVTGALLGTVPPPPENWHEVLGACSDDHGNVYITNIFANDVDEFTHSGSFVKAIVVPGQYSVNCAYDRSSGDLAISSEINTSGGPGSIQIYKHGVLSGPYYPPNMSRVYFLAYEGNTGRLWLDGSDSSGIFHYDSFVHGSFTPVPIQGVTIGFPGSVMWSAKTHTMVVGDQDTFSAPTFYEVNRSGKVLGVVTTTCENPSDFCDIVQASIKGSGLAGPDGVTGMVNRYAYPAGGAPVLTYQAQLIVPTGSAISSNVK